MTEEREVENAVEYPAPESSRRVAFRSKHMPKEQTGTLTHRWINKEKHEKSLFRIELDNGSVRWAFVDEFDFILSE